MALSWKVRGAFAVMNTLTRLRLAPTHAKAVRQPMDKRLAMGPGSRMTGPAPEVPTRDISVTTRDGASIRARVYQPEGATIPVLYAHGGGFAFGGLAACDHICRRLADQAQVVVVSVEYRLSPEYRFPIPLQDCEDVLDWLLTQPWDSTRLVVAGDSAGGNLAAALALRLRERGTALAGQLLIYPALDLTAAGRGVQEYRGIGLSAQDCRLCAELYLGDQDRTQPYASPLHAPDLAGLPPALVITVGHDPLHDEGCAYAERLREAGVPANVIDLPDHVHGSLSLPVLYDGIDELYRRMGDFLRDPAGVCAGALPQPRFGGA